MLLQKPNTFWEKVKLLPNGCMLWTGALDEHGYGNTKLAGAVSNFAHRVAYEEMWGPVDKRLHLDHLCRNRACVNPTHLEPVTPRENLMRSPIARAAVNARKTHCHNGHEYTPENTGKSRGGVHRYCLTCKAAWSHERHLKLYRPRVRGPRTRQTHCRRGHEYTVTTTTILGNGAKTCRVCINKKQNDRYHARKKLA